MAEKKSLKTALLLSFLMLAICVASMIGSTYAWFNDTVVSERNVIHTGSLDVDLEFSHDGETWHTLQDTTRLFDESSQFKPGTSQMVFLRIENEGNLHLKYQLTMNILKEIGSTNMLGENFKMSDYMMVGVLDKQELQTLISQYGEDGGYKKVMETYNRAPKAMAEEQAKTRFSQAVNLLRLEPSINGVTPNPNLTEAYLAPKDADVIALIVYTPSHLDQQINYKTGYNQPQILFGIDVVAGQRSAGGESDSFGDDYDVDAIYPSTISDDIKNGKLPWPEFKPQP